MALVPQVLQEIRDARPLQTVALEQCRTELSCCVLYCTAALESLLHCAACVKASAQYEPLALCAAPRRAAP